MASDVKFKTVLDALQSTPLSNEVHQASDSPVIVNGPMVIDSGDAILIKGPQSVELEAFTLFLSLSLTKEGDLFSGLRCDIAQNVIYIVGRGTRKKLAKRINAIDGNYDKSRIIAVTYDQIDLENRLDLSEEIHREYLIEGIKSREGQAGVVSFDDTTSLIVSGPDKSIKQDIRIFMERLMEINILQIWTCPDSKGASPLPDDLFDFVFRVAPDQDSDCISFSVTCERNAYLGQMKFPPVNLELSQEEGGKLRMVDRGLVRSERNAAILLAVNGQTQAQIGQLLGRDQSTVSLWLKKAKEDGLINRDGNSYILTTKGRKALNS